MIHLAGPYLLAAALVGLGVFGIAVRRNAVLLLVGVELVLSGALVLLENNWSPASLSVFQATMFGDHTSGMR